MGSRGKEPNRRNPLSQRVLFDVIFMFSEGFLLFGLMEMFTVKTAWFAGKLQSIHIISHPWTCFLGFSSQWLDGGIFAQGTSKLEDLLRQAFKTIPSEKKWKNPQFFSCFDLPDASKTPIPKPNQIEENIRCFSPRPWPGQTPIPDQIEENTK